jgi:hypothetical protein
MVPLIFTSVLSELYLVVVSFIMVLKLIINRCGWVTLKAKGDYVVLPISQGRDFVITEHGQKKIQARQPQELADNYFSEQHTVRLFNKLGFYFTWQLAQLKKPRFVQSRKQLKPSVSSLIKSDQPERFEVRGVKIL